MDENKNTKKEEEEEEDFAQNSVIDDKYIVLEKLGEGGYGKVYKVKGIKDEKKYALKVLLKEKCSENNFNSFKKEESILRYLNNWENPYILKLYCEGEFTFEGNKRLYFVIDYAEKGDLYHYVKASNIGLGEKYGKILFKKILKGIQFCHAHNICHLDIKTPNILLDDKFNPIIIDFGLSHKIINLAKKKINLLTGPRGTNFMKCPQMFEGIAYNGIDADNFALGTLLFDLVTSQRVFRKADNNSIYPYIKEKNYTEFWKNIILNREDLTEEFKNLYVRMIAYEPTERPKIKDVLKDPWFHEINELEKKDPEGYKNLETEYIKYMLQLEQKFKGIIQPTFETKQKDEKNCGENQNRSLSSDGEQYFEKGLKPKKIYNNKNYKYYIKIKGYIYPVKFMNELMKKINGKYKDKCELQKSEKKLKFIINFKNEEEEEEKEKEKKELEEEQDEEDDEEEEDENNEKENNCIMEVKLFDYGVDEYLLCFNKKQGEIEEFYENFLIIKEIVEKLLI